MKNSLFNLILKVLFVILLILIAAPIVNMLISLSPGLIKYVVRDKEIVRSILFTLEASLYATLFGFLLGIPAAYLLARNDFWGKGVIEAIVDIPVMFPHSAAGIALLSIYGSRFIFGKIFAFFGIEFVDTALGVILGMFFVSFSYLVNSAKEGFKKVDIHLEYVAQNLGATRFQAFRHVVLPNSFSDILSGMIMMWARGLSEFGAVVILAYHPMTAPVMIYERFTSFGLQYSKPISVIMIYVSLIIFIALRFLQHKITVRDKRKR
ncbi:MAG TPA: ABC transporter permease subunit [Candidatus Aminicenantes bacterium]|nr:ABC transporter permease subunit [Candidatus Aminicenantes bacterium]